MKESPIFTRTYDLLMWLLPATIKFPRQQRFVLAATLQQAAFDFQDEIIQAALSSQPRLVLEKADASLSKLRIYIRLSCELSLFSKGQYRHVSAMVDEIGRILGGWIKTV